MTTFDTLGLSEKILRRIAGLGFDTPTPIQVEAIPHLMAGRDLMGLAQTGTGKTAAFGLPLVHHLLAEDEMPGPRCVSALILAPTRELVAQIAENLRSYVHKRDLAIATVVGGASIHNQIRLLARGADILVATPGRLIDLLDRNAVRLDKARFLVLDEADQMLDMGFIHALRKIAPLIGRPRQTMLFSATMPKQMAELAGAYLTDPVRVEAARPGKAADQIDQSVHYVPQAEKLGLLKTLLTETPDGLSLVFARTKHGAERLMKQLNAAGIEAASIHGNKSQNQRDRAIRDFRRGAVRVLVATDVAARGIDIPGVSHVYNFDLPEVPEAYVHRIGRTARAGAAGDAVAFCTPDDFALLLAIEKVMKRDVATASGTRPARPASGGGAGGGAANGPKRRGGPRGRSTGRPGKTQAPRRQERQERPAEAREGAAAKPQRKPRRRPRRARATG